MQFPSLLNISLKLKTGSDLADQKLIPIKPLQKKWLIFIRQSFLLFPKRLDFAVVFVNCFIT